MKLDLSPPAGWTVSDAVAHPPASPGTTLSWSTLALLPTRPELWLESVRATGLAPGEHVKEISRTAIETDTGWPLTLIEDAVLVDGATVGVRLLALYTFRELAGSAILRTPDHAAYFAVMGDVHACLFAARPNFGGVVACLSDFWEEVPSSS